MPQTGLPPGTDDCLIVLLLHFTGSIGRSSDSWHFLSENLQYWAAWEEKYFKCGKCHKAEEMHGNGMECANKYDVENGLTCVACHEDIYKDGAKNARQHNDHKDKLSCRVRRSMPYKTCYTCHVGKDDQGRTYYQTKGSMIDFKIGSTVSGAQYRPVRTRRTSALNGHWPR